MLGTGVAEEAGLLGSLIRRLVRGAHPLGFDPHARPRRRDLLGRLRLRGVAAIFMVNIIFTPTDGMITEIANESIALAGGGPVTIVATYYFMIATSLLL
ncbi:hypothetical protein ACI3ET_10720 [Ornithinimicrobium sp. LYQ121]|uniref:hypothetical protein n=1 Tax=Ornithinimicrobium sp. LYQ121 TaxID=3378801 RepID=UPI003852E2BC